MTIINRALLKAYERHADSVAASELEQHPSAVVRGWARKLREPIRELPREQMPEGQLPEGREEGRPANGVEPQASVPQAPVEHKTEEPVISVRRSDGTRLRIDEAHPRISEKPQTTSQTELASAPIKTPSYKAPPRPVWTWPSIVERLLTCTAADDLRALADHLHELASHCDQRCLAFGGPGRRAGRTSLIVTLAWVLTEEKSSRVAIVDANFDNPGLAQLLSFRSDSGLDQLLVDRNLDAEELATDLSERLTIVPMVERIAAESIDREGIGAVQSLLRSLCLDHDLVLIDAGPWEPQMPPPILECRTIDAFVCVARSGRPATANIDAPDLAQLGIDWLGQIETFVPAQRA